jgi:hypothetical protein
MDELCMSLDPMEVKGAPFTPWHDEVLDCHDKVPVSLSWTLSPITR